MTNKLAEIILKSRISKNNALDKKQFLPWNKIQTIALVLSNNNTINKSAVDKFINDSQKHIEVFLIELKSKNASFNDWHCFTKKDKTILNLPKKNHLINLQNQKFDLIINAAQEFNLFAASITSELKAPFKCGLTSNFNENDLIIQKTNPFSLINYLNDVLRYLKLIKEK
jgi:hypothetical protein